MSDYHNLPIYNKPITEGVYLRRTPGGIETNIPRRVVEHSPTGYEWGYGGSGPADLALNILEEALRALRHHGPRQECWRGDCYKLAWMLHQVFKWEFVATMPHEGGVIYWRVLCQWLFRQCHSLRICEFCAMPIGECNCGVIL